LLTFCCPASGPDYMVPRIRHPLPRTYAQSLRAAHRAADYFVPDL